MPVTRTRPPASGGAAPDGAPPSPDAGATGPADAPPANARAHRWGRRARALGGYLALIFALVTLNFALPRAMPGNPIDGLLGQSSASFTLGEQSRRALEEYYGLNGSLASQYRHYLARLAHGDLGRSISTNAPVRKEITRRLPWTVLLIGSSLALASLIGLVAGVHSGWRRDRPMDRALMTVLLAVREFPAFLLGSLLLFAFAVKHHWFPPGGRQDLFNDSLSPLGRALDVGWHLVLPVAVLTIGLTVGNYLIMRAGMVNELGSDYLLLGRAKGLRPRRLKYRYAARNALLPVLSLTGLQLGFVVTGDVLIERVFSYRGLGGLLFDSVVARDYPTIQGAFLIVSVSVVTINALVDLAYRRLDPRTAT